jgi:ABC-type Fe3+-hydroxamate transport system substrate-binding protein
MSPCTDDLGTPVEVPQIAERVVSLVPSLTEALASMHPERLVGATQWCTHPSGLDVLRVRGTKNPDLALIRDLRPDLVIANKEENRALDVSRLRETGVPVWVTDIRTVPEAVRSLQRLFDSALGWDRPAWLEDAEHRWTGDLPPVVGRVAIAIWRDPWMVVGSDTFTGDLIRRLGWENIYADSPDRYPAVSLEDLDHSGADAVLLPDEPYEFSPSDGPEAFRSTPTQLVSGRLLTWYGPSLAETTPSLDDPS